MSVVTSKHLRLASRKRAAASASSRERPTPQNRSRDESFEIAAAAVLGRLRDAVAALLAGAPGPTGKCTDVQATFGIDPKLAWQIFRIATAENPLAAGGSIPASVSMQRLLKAATRRRIPAEVVAGVSESYGAFERMVAEHAGDRATLEAMLSTFVPESREKTELASKQAAFKAMSQIRGVAIEAEVQAHLLHPSEDRMRADVATMRAELGLRRVNPNAHISFGWREVENGKHSVLTLDREPIRGPNDTLLAEFCSSPPARFESRTVGKEWYTFMPGVEVGLRSAVDIVTAEYGVARLRRYRQAGEPKRSGIMAVMDSPLKRLTMDVFLHRDIYPDAAPGLDMMETVSHGPAVTFDDPRHDQDRLYMQETVAPIAGGLAHARIAHVPRYSEMLVHMCRKLGWSPAEFRGYRLDVQYPVYGVEYMMGFELPARLS
jgi:hypothetical protein